MSEGSETSIEKYIREPERESQLNALQPNLKAWWFKEVPSTMDVARMLSPEVVATQNTGIVIADHQTAGRGRQGREWASVEDSVAATWIEAYPGKISDLAGFSLGAGLAIARTLDELGCHVHLKWPNDVMWVSGTTYRKIAGILIETEEVANQTMLLIGIGLNIFGNAEDVPQAGNLFELFHVRPSKEEIISSLSFHLGNVMEAFRTGNGFSELRAEWIKLSVLQDKHVWIDTGTEMISGICSGVSESGLLLVQTGDKLRAVASGHILSWGRSAN